MSHDKDQDAVDFLLKMVEHNGVAVSTVRDGTVLLFKRAYLQALVEQYANQEVLTIFVKRPDPESAN